MYIYLQELDSAIQDKRMIRDGIYAFFEEIFINGNTVVLSLNQLADSGILKLIISNDDLFNSFITLLDNNNVIIDYQCFEETNSVGGISITKYLIKCLEHEDHIFTNLPIKNDTKEFDIVRNSLTNSDVTLLEKLDENIRDEMKRYVKLMTYMSLEEKYQNKSIISNSKGFPDYINLLKMIDNCTEDDEFYNLYEQAIEKIDKIMVKMSVDKLSKRSAWYKAIRLETIAEEENSRELGKENYNTNLEAMCLEIINVCSLFHLEQNINNIVTHSDKNEPESMSREMITRLYYNYKKLYEQYFSNNAIRRDLDPQSIETYDFSDEEKKDFKNIVEILDRKTNHQTHRKNYFDNLFKKFQVDNKKTYEKQIEMQKKQVEKDYRSVAIYNLLGFALYFILFMAVQFALELMPVDLILEKIPYLFLRHVIELFITAMLSSLISYKFNLPDGFVSIALFIKTIRYHNFYRKSKYRGYSFNMNRVKELEVSYK